MNPERSNPLVTVVTPSFNQAKYLEQTILSVLNQDYPNIEFIVFDGGSTDGSVEILQKYSSRLSYWKSEKDEGQSDAINKGWQMARGEICSYLNSDDLLAPGAVRKIVEAFQANPEAGIIFGDYEFIGPENNVVEEGKGRPCNHRTLLIHGQMPYIVQPSSFYRTSLIRQIGYLDKSLRLSMDYDLLLKLTRIAPAHYTPYTISQFRVYPDTKSYTLADKHWKETLKIKFRYNPIYSIKSILLYFRFRLFRILPDSFQRYMRQRRNSINDKVILNR